MTIFTSSLKKQTASTTLPQAVQQGNVSTRGVKLTVERILLIWESPPLKWQVHGGKLVMRRWGNECMRAASYATLSSQMRRRARCHQNERRAAATCLIVPRRRKPPRRLPVARPGPKTASLLRHRRSLLK